MTNDGKPFKRIIKPSQLAGLRPPWKPGESPKSPGRPRSAPDVVEARRILKEASAGMAAKLKELSNHRNPDIAIKAINVSLDKVLPNLEEVDNFEHRPLQQFTDDQLNAKLTEINASGNGDTPRIGTPS